LFAAGVSVAPIFLTWALARRLGLAPGGAALLVVIPTYTSRLSFAFLPALFGHAFDLALIVWLASHLDRLVIRRVWLAGAGWMAAYGLLRLGRARVPAVFLHGHETLLVTPLVCLAAGVALAALARLSRVGRFAAAAAALLLAIQGLAGQWQAVAAQLANAR